YQSTTPSGTFVGRSIRAPTSRSRAQQQARGNEWQAARGSEGGEEHAAAPVHAPGIHAPVGATAAGAARQPLPYSGNVCVCNNQAVQTGLGRKRTRKWCAVRSSLKLHLSNQGEDCAPGQDAAPKLQGPRGQRHLQPSVAAWHMGCVQGTMCSCMRAQGHIEARSEEVEALMWEEPNLGEGACSRLPACSGVGDDC
ncbi:hypothetical protein HaLaN_16111, partial [Haematococcus lacustris]